jgi:2,3-bisphosphoglycerate-dependent phosphoglycerate mutase
MTQAAEAQLVLVRHGETEWNLQGRIQGYDADSALTANGRAQAVAVAERLRHEGIDLLFASDTGRTLSTAEPIAAATGVALIRERDLRERAYGIFEGRTFAEIAVEYPEAYELMRARDPHYKAPGGESAIEFQARVIGAMERIAARSTGKRAAVVTHQGVLGVLYRHVNRLGFNEPHRPKLLNASCNHFRFAAGEWFMDAWCDVSHLPEAELGE